MVISMALNSYYSMCAAAFIPLAYSRRKPRRSCCNSSYYAENVLSGIHSNSCNAAPKRTSFRISADLKARFIAKRSETTSVQQLQRPLVEYMSLPASQYSVLDAERIERVNENTFRCYVYRLKFFSFEVCPVLLVRVDEEPDGCCIRLLSCKLEGSPIVVAQNDKFSASMVNKISCNSNLGNSSVQQLTSDTTIEVVIDIPFAFQAIPVQVIESTGTQVLEQLLKIMLPRFLTQGLGVSIVTSYWEPAPATVFSSWMKNTCAIVAFGWKIDLRTFSLVKRNMTEDDDVSWHYIANIQLSQEEK